MSTSSTTKFSTFTGVFTPSMLTIFGVIMFMRAGYVVGQAGVKQALLILIFAKAITTLTTFSISAITTNMEVKGGGAYYLISRTLGAEFGGTIGLTLFLAQTLSIPLYILGFTEALVTSYPLLEAYQLYIVVGITLLIFLVTLKGAGGAMKIQMVILLILITSILFFMLGLALHFSSAQLSQNLAPYTPSIQDSSAPKVLSFWQLFAIYFPAVTGIMAGINMSGDLENPSQSIPKGTFLAIGVGFLVYGLQIILLGGGVDRLSLITDPYGALLMNAFLGAGFIVSLGVYAATLSSGLGSFVGAPRILAALALDKILKPFNSFAKLSSSGEPRRAVVLSFILSVVIIILAERSGPQALNVVSAGVSMFFLWAYGIINVAAFVESSGGNPSFRPTFKLFHWSLALLGALGCITVAFLINALAAFIALILIVALFFYVRHTVLETSFGDARRGYFYSRVQRNLHLLENMPDHAKNWRPTILLYSEFIDSKMDTMVHFTQWFGGRRGIVFFGQVLQGSSDTASSQYHRAIDRIQTYAREHNHLFFPSVAVAPHIETGFQVLLQTVGIGPIRPNLLYMHLSEVEGSEQEAAFIRRMNSARQLSMSVLLNVLPEGWEAPLRKNEKRIDIWWRGQSNGALMVTLSWLLKHSSVWSGTTIRLIRLVEDDATKSKAVTEMQQLVKEARMEALVYPIIDHVSDFKTILLRESKDAQCVFMGMDLPVRDEENFFVRTKELAQGLPPIFFVASAGEVDLLA